MIRSLPLILVPALASAGTTLTWERSRGDGAAAQLTMKCEGSRVRFEGSEGAGRILLWDAEKKTVTILRPADHTYSQLTEQQLIQLRERMKGAAEILRGRLSDPRISAEQRAQLEMLLGSQKDEGEWVFKPTGKKDKVGKWDCELYEGERGKTKSQVCMVPWASAPVKKEDLDCAKSLSGLFSVVGKNVTGDALDVTKFPGFPVHSVRTAAEGTPQSSTVKSVEKGKLPADLFTVPKDFKPTRPEALGPTDAPEPE